VGQTLLSVDTTQDRTLSSNLEEPHLAGELLIYQANLKFVLASLLITTTQEGYYESLNNLTPEDVFLARGSAILEKRNKINLKTMAKRKLLHRHAMAA